MANQAYVDRLKGDVEKWNEWRSKYKDVIPDLKKANLNEANLHGASLSGADLSKANLQGANLQGANVNRANLQEAGLSQANLNKANLQGANLSGADLSNTNLIGSDLSGADLSNANLRMAYLRDANLSGRVWSVSGTYLRETDLSGADLSNANLEGVNLQGATLRAADLHKVSLGRTLFIDVDLKDVLNLESCDHRGSSTIDHLTYEKSKRLPTMFLRGCGLPDSLIDNYPSLLNQPISFYSCFISYSHNDKSFARRLHDQLQGRGIRCWLDEHQIQPGDDIYAEVEKGLKLWDKVLLCASESSLQSWWVERELDRAFKREMDLTKLRKKPVLSIIPMNLDGYLFNWEHPHASALQKRHAADFVGWENDNSKFGTSFENVVKALNTDDTGRDHPPLSKL